MFFGGGTPSLMEPETVAAILENIRQSWPTANDLEITLEANPTSVEADKFAAFADAGVNRVSMGIQALNDGDLKRLGRLHSAKEARVAFDVARDRFERVSFDLIYARQDQTLAAWTAELQQALSLAVDHLSLYQLTIEPGTAFGDRYDQGMLKGLPDDDHAADMFDLTQDLCAAAGRPAYEVSNHAADQAQSRHNLIYWRYGDYIGIGPGAHGRLTIEGQRFATETDLSPLAWLMRVERTGTGDASRQVIAPKDQASEYAMMSMRLSEGMDRARFERLAGRSLSKERLGFLSDVGMIEIGTSHIATTLGGRRVLNAVLADLLQD